MGMRLLSVAEWFKIQPELENIDLSRLQELFGSDKVNALRRYKSLLETLKMMSNEVIDISTLKRRYRFYGEIEEMTFAQFISIETTLQNVRDPKDMFVLVCSELLRPLSEKVYDNENVLMNNAHREAISDEEVPYMMELFGRFMKERNDFHYRKYRDVFIYESEDSDSGGYDSATSFYRNWHWYSYVRELSNEDISRYEQTMLLPMKVVAPEISSRQGLAKVEKQRMAEQEEISKAKMRR